MALTGWDPFTTLARLDPDFDELVRRAWGNPARGAGARSSTSRPSSGATAGYVPAIEMATDGSDVLISLELPGVDVDKDVDIEVAEGRLTISGQRRDRLENSEQKSETRVLVRELRYGSFRREFALPEGVGADDVEAAYENGMLHVRVRHVTKPAQAPKKVTIRSGAADQHQTIEGKVENSDEDRT